MMNRTLPIIAALALVLASAASGQAPYHSPAPIVPADDFAGTPLPNAYSGGLPGISVAPPVHQPVHIGCDAGCGGGCVGCCQGNCQGDGLVGCLSPCRRKCPPNCACPLCLHRHMWFSGGYMLTYVKALGVPPLVTTSPDGTPRNLAGRLPGATILYGGEGEGGNLQSGAQVEFGRWMGEGHVGLAGRYFFTEIDDNGFEAHATGTSPILGLPYFDPIAGIEDAILISHPDVATDGSVWIDNDLEAMSAEAQLRFRIARSQGVEVDLLGGYHFVRVDNGLLMHSTTTDIDATNAIADGTVIDIVDSFSTENRFHGGSLGMNMAVRHSRLTLRGMAKVSVGNMRQQLAIAGRTVNSTPNPPGAPIVGAFDNGLYAQPSNIGTYARDRTAFIPEASLKLGYMVNRCTEINVGYSMLFLTRVALAGNQIDRVVDIAPQAVPAAGPLVNFRDTSLWIQGITCGLSYNY